MLTLSIERYKNHLLVQSAINKRFLRGVAYTVWSVVKEQNKMQLTVTWDRKSIQQI